MPIRWSGDEIRRDMAAREFQSVGLSPKAAEALAHIGVFSVKELLDSPWSDEEAGRRFVGLHWRLSVSPYASARLLAHIEACRSQLQREQRAA